MNLIIVTHNMQLPDLTYTQLPNNAKYFSILDADQIVSREQRITLHFPILSYYAFRECVNINGFEIKSLISASQDMGLIAYEWLYAYHDGSITPKEKIKMLLIEGFYIAGQDIYVDVK